MLDNVSYHNARTYATISPTSATLKASMITWLNVYNIKFYDIYIFYYKLISN